MLAKFVSKFLIICACKICDIYTNRHIHPYIYKYAVTYEKYIHNMQKPSTDMECSYEIQLYMLRNKKCCLHQISIKISLWKFGGTKKRQEDRPPARCVASIPAFLPGRRIYWQHWCITRRYPRDTRSDAPHLDTRPLYMLVFLSNAIDIPAPEYHFGFISFA